MRPMGDDTRTISGKRALLALLGLAAVMAVVMVLLIGDIRRRKADVYKSATQPTTQPAAVSNDPH